MNALSPFALDAADYARRAARLREARKLSGVVNTISVDRACPVASQPGTEGDRRPFGIARDPCGRCGTRGDLGCTHQRPSGERPPL